MESDKRMIDFKGFRFFLFKRIKRMIILVIIGVLMGGGISFVAGNSLQPESKSEQEINKVKETLSVARQNEVEKAYSSYKSLNKQKNDIRDYLANSIFLNLNESKAKMNSVVFSINGSAKAKAITVSYQKLLKNDKLYQQINKALKINVKSSYLSELVYIYDGNENKSTVNIQNNEHSDSFVINIYGNSNKECELIYNCVANRVNVLTDELKKSFGNFELHRSNETYEPINPSEINSARSNYNQQLSDIDSVILNMRNNLNQDQQTYFDALVDNSIMNVKRGIGSKLKWMFVFAIGGGLGLFVLYLFYLIFVYISDGKIHTVNEFSESFGINIISDIDKRNEFDWNIAVEEICFIFKKQKIEKIGLVSTTQEEVITKLCDSLNEENISCVKLSSTPKDKKDFEKLLTTKDIIIVEKLFESNFDEIAKILKYYELKGINVIGSILIK